MSTREEIESAVDIARRYRGVCESPKEIIAKEFGVTYFAVVKGMVRDAHDTIINAFLAERATDDTSGHYVGWTIVAEGSDGSLLVQSKTGARRRIWRGSSAAERTTRKAAIERAAIAIVEHFEPHFSDYNGRSAPNEVRDIITRHLDGGTK